MSARQSGKQVGMVQLNVSVTPALRKRLTLFCAEHDILKNQVVSQALVRYLNEQEGKEQEDE